MLWYRCTISTGWTAIMMIMFAVGMMKVGGWGRAYGVSDTDVRVYRAVTRITQ